MAIITSYPTVVPKTIDRLIISQAYDIDADEPIVGNPTGSVTVGSIVDLVNTGLIPGTGTVTSVGVSTPSAFTVSNSPITSAGVINITGSGTSVQYVDGTGALQNSELILNRDSASNTLGNKTIPSDFDFTSIPASYADSIWNIVHYHDLSGATITLPANVTLNFIGGKFSNGGIIGNYTKIDAGLNRIFDLSITFSGTWDLSKVFPHWFNVVNGNVVTLELQKAIDFTILSNAKEFKCVGFSNLLLKELDIQNANDLFLNFKGTKFTSSENATLPTSGFGSVTCIRLKNCNNVELSGLEFYGNNFLVQPIGVDSSVNTNINRNNIHDVGSKGIVSSNGIKTILRYNKVYNTLNASNGIVLGNNNAGFHDNDSVVEHNEIYNCDATGIVFQTSSGNCSYNKVYDCQGSGIITTGAITGEVTKNVVISGNECYGNLFHGIQEDSTASPTDVQVIVSENICYENDNFGIVLVADNNWIISNNICYNNGVSGATSAGIRIEGGTGVVVSGNICYNSTGFFQQIGVSLINFDATTIVSDVVVGGNNCYNNLLDGINHEVVSGAAEINNAVYYGNNCRGNGRYGIAELSFDTEIDSNVSFFGNSMFDNSVSDLRIKSRYVNFSQNNYSTTYTPTIYATFTDLETSPKVKSRTNWRASNTSTTVITNFSDARPGHEINIFTTNGNTTLSGSFKFKDGTTLKLMQSGTAIKLVLIDSVWREV